MVLRIRPQRHNFITDFVYLLRIGARAHCVHDRHITDLPRATWLRLFEEAGFNQRY